MSTLILMEGKAGQYTASFTELEDMMWLSRKKFYVKSCPLYWVWSWGTDKELRVGCISESNPKVALTVA